MTNKDLLVYKVIKLMQDGEGAVADFILDLLAKNTTILDIKTEVIADKEAQLIKTEETRVNLETQITELNK